MPGCSQLWLVQEDLVHHHTTGTCRPAAKPPAWTQGRDTPKSSKRHVRCAKRPLSEPAAKWHAYTVFIISVSTVSDVDEPAHESRWPAHEFRWPAHESKWSRHTDPSDTGTLDEPAHEPRWSRHTDSSDTGTLDEPAHEPAREPSPGIQRAVFSSAARHEPADPVSSASSCASSQISATECHDHPSSWVPCKAVRASSE